MVSVIAKLFKKKSDLIEIIKIILWLGFHSNVLLDETHSGWTPSTGHLLLICKEA